MNKKLFILIVAVGIFQFAEAQLNADFTSNVTLGCAPLTVNFTDSSSGGSIVSWTWTFGQGQSPGYQQNPVHVYLVPGIYTVTLKVCNSLDSMNGDCNQRIKTGYITVLPSLNVSDSAFAAQCGLCDGSATTIVSGGTSPFTYLWNDALGQTTQSATGLCFGIYEVLVTDSNGCTKSDSAHIDNSGSLTATLNATNVSCNGINNGTATASISGGTSPYSLLWSNGQSSETISGLNAGYYYVTVTDTFGCKYESWVSVINSFFTITSIVKTNVWCNGGNNGSATVNHSGGISPYFYLWSNGDTTKTINGLQAGPFGVTVTDSTGCIKSASATITQPAILQVTVNAVDALCNGACDGAATSSVSGGTSPYSYQWWNGTMCQSTQCYNVCSGSYSLSVTDSKGCTDTANFIINQPQYLSPSTTPANTTCDFCDGTDAINAQGGVPPYTVQWSNGATSTMISNLCSGIYSVTITDANNCSSVSYDTITGGVNVSISKTNVSCNGVSDGSATVTPTQGIPPFTYVWSNGQDSSTTTGLPAGSYSVTVTDSIGCTASFFTSITQPSAVNVTVSQTDISCYGSCDGTVAAFVTGGTSPYTYQWTNGNCISTTCPGACPGIYSLTVTDFNGCTDTVSATISQPPPLIVDAGPNGVICNGSTIAIGGSPTAIGGSQPFLYNWNPASGLNNFSIANPVASLLIETTYCVAVTDANGCSDSSCMNLGISAGFTIDINVTNTSCGICNGEASVNITGGVPPFYYLWSDGSTALTATGLCTGSFSVTIIDSIGCVNDTSFFVANSNGFSATMSKTDVTCYGDSNGTATAIPSGGASPYSFIWSNSQIVSTASGLASGTISCTVTDSAGCNFSVVNNIAQPDSLSLSFSGINNISCYGESDGTICANGFGGVSPYSYTWSDSSISDCLDSILAGTYTVTLTDSNACIKSETKIIYQPNPLIASLANKTDASCNLCDGIFQGGVSGGTSGYSYFFQEMNGSNPTWTGLCQGTGYYKVIDYNGCLDSLLVSIGGGSLSFAASSISPFCGLCNGSISIIASGTSPISYTWSTGDTTTYIDSLCAGTYNISVSDTSGCQLDSIIILNNPGGLAATITKTDANCFADSSGTATANPTGGTPPYSFLWSNGQTAATPTGLAAGNYYVTVTDSSSCTFFSSVTISEPNQLTISLNISNVACGNLGQITVNSSGGTPPYQYSIDSGATWQISNLFQNLAAGNYPVKLKDAKSCTISANTVITSTPPVFISSTVTHSSDCNFGNGTVQLSASGGVPPYTYHWTNPNLGYGNSKQNLAPGSYWVEVTDSSGCTKISSPYIINTCTTNVVEGYVFLDQDSNCVKAASDTALKSWHVAGLGSSIAYSTLTDTTGHYKLNLPNGVFQIRVYLPGPLWNQVCPVNPNTYSVNLTGTDSLANINFGIKKKIYCPQLMVYTSINALRPCFNSNFFVNVCNQGTDTETDASVEVLIDNDLNVNYFFGNSATLISQNGNLFLFDLDTLFPKQCKTITFYLFVPCNTPLGSTICAQAHAYPDSSCTLPNPAWDKSSIMVTGSCVNDSLACFTIINHGSGDMQGTSQYKIYEDNILVFTGTFQLASGDSIVICRPANNKTIRLEANQRPNHPGNSHPKAFVEMCGQPVFSLGMINVVPQDDYDDFNDISCMIVTGSYDPNDKNVSPEGLNSQFHFIDSTDILEYQIRFQNTGTDTAFNIYVYDTISPFLDITTFEGGASSHPYTYEIAGAGIVRFAFENVLLPDSNVNEMESHGFVSYSIKQIAGNQKWTMIENKAGIVFDFNAPVITNTVYNTVGNIDSITLISPIIYDEKIIINVFPNPFNSTITFEISGDVHLNNFRLEVMNILGERIMQREKLFLGKIILNMDRNPNGIYFFKIYSGGELAGTGKIIKQ